MKRLSDLHGELHSLMVTQNANTGLVLKNLQVSRSIGGFSVRKPSFVFSFRTWFAWSWMMIQKAEFKNVPTCLACLWIMRWVLLMSPWCQHCRKVFDDFNCLVALSIQAISIQLLNSDSWRQFYVIPRVIESWRILHDGVATQMLCQLHQSTKAHLAFGLSKLFSFYRENNFLMIIMSSVIVAPTWSHSWRIITALVWWVDLATALMELHLSDCLGGLQMWLPASSQIFVIWLVFMILFRYLFSSYLRRIYDFDLYKLLI